MEIPLELLEKLRTAQTIAVLTGAGISAESGIPTFREAQTGLWAQHDPQELATPQAFQRNPRLVWEWYTWRRELVGSAEPNAGHMALVELENQTPHFTLITQNIDGLHQAAGSQQIIELHGNINRTKCFEGCGVIESWEESGEIPPRCPQCDGLLRPDVVWFGEGLSQEVLQRAVKASQQAEIFFSIGTSSVVQPAASLPLYALQNGAMMVEINPIATPLTPMATHVLSAPAGDALPALVNEAWPNI